MTNNKYCLILLLCFALSLLTARAQEKLYVATDRGAYISGDRVFFSLFCVDETGRQSDFSAVSYLELISTDGTVAEAKAGLFGGRGAGSFLIPASAPTGNYLLIAYTAGGEAVPEGSRLIAVYNATSTARVKDGVTVVPQDRWSAPEPKEQFDEFLVISRPRNARCGSTVPLRINAPAGTDICLSVSREDGLATPDGKSLDGFLHGSKAAPTSHSGEYEGEIIVAQVEGLERGAQDDNDRVTAFLSSAGSPSNIYIGRSDTDGQIRFFSNNIYGNLELVCEVASMSGRSCHISFASPFSHPESGPLPALTLSKAQQSALEARKAALKAESARNLDTLVQFLPKRNDLLLAGISPIRYHLDDYTRFPTVREICVEFIPELQFAKKDGQWRVRMYTGDVVSSRQFLLDNILVLMDGVVLTDHGMLEDFDAMLLEDIDIYSQAVTIGEITFNGIVNFITKKNYVTALHFPENVRVVDFMGVSYPVAYPGSASAEEGSQLLYWNPALQVPQEGCSVDIHLPSDPGTFRVTAEGWTPDGRAVRSEILLETADK